jgi:hypothetical protein
MRAAGAAILCFFLVSGGLGRAQDTLEVTGIAIPSDLLKKNFGAVPKGIGAYDVTICNLTEKKQTVASSKIYQNLTHSNPTLAPIGKQIMLAAILRNQNLSTASLASVVLNSVTGVFSILNSSNYKLPGGFAAASALTTLTGQQLFSSFRPILAADQLEKFETQALEPTLLLDGEACAERTIFVRTPGSKPKRQADPMNFHIQ